MLRLVLLLSLLLLLMKMSESLNIFNSMGGSINAANTPCPLIGPPVMTSERQSIDLCMG